jgi:hypothetical protein
MEIPSGSSGKHTGRAGAVYAVKHVHLQRLACVLYSFANRYKICGKLPCRKKFAGLELNLISGSSFLMKSQKS